MAKKKRSAKKAKAEPKLEIVGVSEWDVVEVIVQLNLALQQAYVLHPPDGRAPALLPVQPALHRLPRLVDALNGADYCSATM